MSLVVQSWRVVFSIFLSVVLLLSTPVTVLAEHTSNDDWSWAVTTDTVRGPGKQQAYDEFIQECNTATEGACKQEEAFRLQMNMYQPRSVRNYTETGFLKIKAPPAVFQLVKDFWETNRNEQVIEWKRANPYHNLWEAPPTILSTENRTLPGGGPRLQAAIANAARDAMEAWTGLPQASTSVYGIRVYHNQSILAPHVDRLPLVSSAIINVAQDVDEDWFLEVYDHDGVAHNVTMEPGDLVLYESHSIIHGRPYPLQGKFYANIFVHFEPLGLPIGVTEEEQALDHSDVPPYLIQGSSWEPEWRNSFPDGWGLLDGSIAAVQRGDLPTLRYLASIHPEKLHEHDGTKAEWAPIHEAVREGFVDIVKYLIEEQGADPNRKCLVNGGMTPLELAIKYHGSEHTVTKYLESAGGVDGGEPATTIIEPEL